MQVVVATHGHCFDGLSSAVLFTRLLSSIAPGATFSYRACGYGKGQLVPDDGVFSGTENAILDYRFVPTKRLTWYFDHHPTAFLRPEDRAFFDERVGTGRYFYEPACTSCTKLIERVSREQFGVRSDPLKDLVHWADVIDSAGFESPAQALDQSIAALRLAAIVERYGDDGFLAQTVPELSRRTLEEVVELPEMRRRYEGLAELRKRFIQRVERRAERRGRVVFVDLTDEPMETIGKFVTYALYPDAVYSVLIGLMKKTVKISVGYNPWSGRPRDLDLGAICARYGGGGHGYVGATQFDRSDLDRARAIAHSITEELSA